MFTAIFYIWAIVKYGGRINTYPFGFFSEGNYNFSADLLHKLNLKILLGSAFSKNISVSNDIGEGQKISNTSTPITKQNSYFKLLFNKFLLLLTEYRFSVIPDELKI